MGDGGRLLLTAFLVVIIGGGLVFGLVFAFNSLDEHALIPHDRRASISIEPGWMNGETKACIAKALPVEDSSDSKPIDVGELLECGNGGELHIMQIRFWGRVKRPEIRPAGWVWWWCKRDGSSFTCSEKK